MFDKIMKNLGGRLFYGFAYDWQQEKLTVDLISVGNSAGTSYIDVPTGHDITI